MQAAASGQVGRKCGEEATTDNTSFTLHCSPQNFLHVLASLCSVSGLTSGPHRHPFGSSCPSCSACCASLSGAFPFSASFALAGFAVGSLGLCFPLFSSPPVVLGSVEELAIEVAVVQVVQEITRRSTGRKHAPSPCWRATSRRRAAVRF